MCNALNHSSNCRCGWGGDGHLGAHGSTTAFRPLVEPIHYNFKNLNSYTNPNARCPVCAQRVFFYQSPNGGRVFFDKLGEDWPKHPCTDNSSYQPTFRKSANPQVQQNQPGSEALKLRGLPMAVTRIESHQFADYAKIRATVGDEELNLWTTCYQLNEGAPFFYIDLGNGVYSIESILVNKYNSTTIISFTAYQRQMDFEASRSKKEHTKPTLAVKRFPTQKKKLLGKRKSKNSLPKNKQTEVKNSKNIPKNLNTIMSFAFEKAGKLEQRNL